MISRSDGVRFFLAACVSVLLVKVRTDRGQQSEQPAHAIAKDCLNSLGYQFGRAADKKHIGRSIVVVRNPAPA